MKNNEVYYFIAACLTISSEKKNRTFIRKKLQSGIIDWDKVVIIGSSNFVLPALYCNLKNVNFLSYLPEDLVRYLKYINDINMERNMKIISQAKKINKILLSNGIKPIFLKGVGNLFANLYNEISQRMIGDIDFICCKSEYHKSIKILKKNGYKTLNKIKNPQPKFRHYNRLIVDEEIAAVEVHKELVVEKYAHEFNFDNVVKDTQSLNSINFLSYSNKLNLSIISNQINDNGFLFKTISLRNAYDVFLLSKKINSKDSINTLNELKYSSNCFLACCFKIFNNVESIKFHKSSKTDKYLMIFDLQLLNTSKTILKRKLLKIYLSVNERIKIFRKIIFHKDYRSWFQKKLSG